MLISGVPWDIPHIYFLYLLLDVDGFKAGSVYVGQSNGKKSDYITGGSIPNRLADKYGWGLFHKEVHIACESFTREDLSNLEKAFINEHMEKGISLNVRKGGHVDAKRGKIYRYSLGGKYLDSWRSYEEIVDSFGGHPDGVGHIVNYMDSLAEDAFPTKSFKGFLWSRKKRDNIKPYIGCNKAVYLYTIDGEYVMGFPSRKEAMLFLKGGKNISSVVDNPNKIYKGYQLRSYKVDNCGKYAKSFWTPVDMFSDKGVLQKSFNTMTSAARFIGVPPCSMGDWLKNKGFYKKGEFCFRYKENLNN